jgi:hypothetical protein
MKYIVFKSGRAIIEARKSEILGVTTFTLSAEYPDGTPFDGSVIHRGIRYTFSELGKTKLPVSMISEGENEFKLISDSSEAYRCEKLYRVADHIAPPEDDYAKDMLSILTRLEAAEDTITRLEERLSVVEKMTFGTDIFA